MKTAKFDTTILNRVIFFRSSEFFCASLVLSEEKPVTALALC